MEAHSRRDPDHPVTHRERAQPIVCIVGPTASGKSALALEVAARFGGEIVSTDSLQVYRHLDIGTAKPTREERARIPHHLIDRVDPDEPFSAGRYVQEAHAALDDLARRGKVPVLCGGTGLYFRALMEGLAEVPPVPDAVKCEVSSMWERDGIEACHAELSRVDPDLAERIHPRHSSRILRALEVFRATGRRLSDYQRESPFRPIGDDVLLVGITWEREALRARIRERVRAMLNAGWVGEVRGILAMGFSPRLKPLRAIGYREIVESLNGERTEAALEADIALRTQQYAKRQMTWFRREPRILWAAPGETVHLLGRIEQHLAAR